MRRCCHGKTHGNGLRQRLHPRLPHDVAVAADRRPYGESAVGLRTGAVHLPAGSRACCHRITWSSRCRPMRAKPAAHRWRWAWPYASPAPEDIGVAADRPDCRGGDAGDVEGRRGRGRRSFRPGRPARSRSPTSSRRRTRTLLRTDNPSKLMAFGRAARRWRRQGAEKSIRRGADAGAAEGFDAYSTVASVSAGVEVRTNEVVVVGKARRGPGR